MPTPDASQLDVQVVKYGFNFLQLIETMLGYTRQFFDVVLNITTDPALFFCF
jgi:hypothetical protein